MSFMIAVTLKAKNLEYVQGCLFWGQVGDGWSHGYFELDLPSGRHGSPGHWASVEEVS